jgi:hypothetical protein
MATHGDLTNSGVRMQITTNSLQENLMNNTNSNQLTSDLAGLCPVDPNYLQIRARMNRLVERYLSLDILSHRLSDLPTQFTQPHTRIWEPIDWKGIAREQIIGVDPDLFVMLVAGATEIEAPIREYSQESWSYMQSIHPQMAYFLGGEQAPDGSVVALGVWEREERQHAPTFSKIYHLLTGEKLQPKPNSVDEDGASKLALADVYRHTLSRISTEWGATSVYLWLMAHSTGALQQAIAQPLQDEINHLAKFWGFSRWAFGGTYFKQLKGSAQNLVGLMNHHQGERTDGGNILGAATTVDAIELAFSFSRVMVRMYAWNRELSDSFLNHLFAPQSQLSEYRFV